MMSLPRDMLLAGVVALGALASAGCDGQSFSRPAAGELAVPYPVDLLLPQSVSIHPFTAARAFEGGRHGLDVRIEAKDAFGDPVKAFGEFRFELYEHRPFSGDPKGRLLMTWHEDLLEPEKNLLHWNIHRTYEFRLLWQDHVAPAQRLVLRVVFSSPFTQRLLDERVFIAGQ